MSPKCVYRSQTSFVWCVARWVGGICHCLNQWCSMNRVRIRGHCCCCRRPRQQGHGAGPRRHDAGYCHYGYPRRSRQRRAATSSWKTYAASENHASRSPRFRPLIWKYHFVSFAVFAQPTETDWTSDNVVGFLPMKKAMRWRRGFLEFDQMSWKVDWTLHDKDFLQVAASLPPPPVRSAAGCLLPGLPHWLDGRGKFQNGSTMPSSATMAMMMGIQILLPSRCSQHFARGAGHTSTRVQPCRSRRDYSKMGQQQQQHHAIQSFNQVEWPLAADAEWPFL